MGANINLKHPKEENYKMMIDTIDPIKYNSMSQGLTK